MYGSCICEDDNSHDVIETDMMRDDDYKPTDWTRTCRICEAVFDPSSLVDGMCPRCREWHKKEYGE